MMNPMANSPCRGCRMITHSRNDAESLLGFTAPLTCSISLLSAPCPAAG